MTFLVILNTFHIREICYQMFVTYGSIILTLCYQLIQTFFP